MGAVHAVKVADGDYGGAEVVGNVGEFVEDLHSVFSSQSRVLMLQSGFSETSS